MKRQAGALCIFCFMIGRSIEPYADASPAYPPESLDDTWAVRLQEQHDNGSLETTESEDKKSPVHKKCTTADLPSPPSPRPFPSFSLSFSSVSPHLRHQSDLASHPRHVERANVHAVEEHGPRLRVVEPEEEVEHRRLAVAGRAHLTRQQLEMTCAT